MTQRLVNYLCKELLARRGSLLITAALNFAPQTVTFVPHMLHHFRNLPLAFNLFFKVFKDSSLSFSLFFSLSFFLSIFTILSYFAYALLFPLYLDSAICDSWWLTLKWHSQGDTMMWSEWLFCGPAVFRARAATLLKWKRSLCGDLTRSHS